MPQVTSVEPQKKDSHRFNVFIDGLFAFGADEDLIVNYRLVPGKQVTSEDLEKLLLKAEIGKLMERMYGLFSIRQRSEKEVRDYLKNLSFKRKTKDQDEISESVIDRLVERLKQKGMVDDVEFAKAWIEARRRSKQKGKIALKMELFQKGIDREIVGELLTEQVTGESEEILAAKALEKKMRLWQNLLPQEFKQKATEFLMRRGFEYEVVRPVVEKLGKNR